MQTLAEVDPKELMERLSPDAKLFMTYFIEEVGFSSGERVVYSAIIAFILSEETEGGEILAALKQGINPGDPEEWEILTRRMKAIRKIHHRQNWKIMTRTDMELFLDARGVFDSEKRRAVADRLSRRIYDQGSRIVQLLEEEKMATSRSDPRFARGYAENNPWVSTSEKFREFAGESRKLLHDAELFFEQLRRERPDLYRVHIWPIRVLDEAERVQAGLPPVSEEVPKEDPSRSFFTLFEERDRAKAELLERGFIQGSDDYERAINFYEARIRRFLEEAE